MTSSGARSGRLFLAAELPAVLKEALAGYALETEADFPGRYVPPANYHVTLAFLGDTSFDVVPVLEKVLIDAAAGTKPFAARITKAGHFGRPQQAIIWAGLSAENILVQLASKVRRGLDAASIAYDPKPPRPHITLARGVNLTSRTLPRPPEAEGTISDLTVFHSTRRDGALVYLPLATTYLR